MNFSTKRHRDALTTMLSLLKVKYTDKYAVKYFNEHPYKYSLYGLSRMLTHYGVRNMGIKLKQKEDIYSLRPPFIAHIGNDFVTVKSFSTKNIDYYWHEKELTIPLKRFFDIWSGVVLVAEADEKSVEPDYKLHKKEELIVQIQKILLLLMGSIIIGIALCRAHILQNPGIALLLLFNVVGIYIGYLLMQKQANIRSKVADKICSLFAQSECNDVLSSPAANFLGVIGWSELGLGYFFSNTWLLLFAPDLLPYLLLLSICVLPYSFWSIWYQKFKVKTWCPLCLIVQVIFCLSFATCMMFRLMQIPDFLALELLAIASIYGIPFLLINLSFPYYVQGRKLMEITQRFNSLKTNDKVFWSMLKEQPYYEINKDLTTITFGDRNAKNIITVFSNPHCAPCADMHTRIMKLLEDTGNQFCIRYILSSFDRSLDSSCDFFLYINKKYTQEQRNNIYDAWFEKGKYDRENFFKKYSFTIGDKEVSEEYQKHLNWKEKTKIQATPTVMFDGYELPEMFFQQIEKLAFFTDLEIDPR